MASGQGQKIQIKTIACKLKPKKMAIRSLFLLCFFMLSAQISAQRNVVLIIADDLGSDYCGFYEDHGDTVKLPNVRRLLSRGVRFRKAWSNPLCSPTRAGILTGRHSFRTDVGDAVGNGSNVIDTNETTIPKLLRAWSQGNVKCANIGKWHLTLGSQSTFRVPNKMGYNHYEGNFSGTLPSFFSWNKVTNGMSAQVNSYATTENTNNAISWVKAQGNSPFFLWLAYNSPHTPYHLPPAGLHSYDTLSGTASAIAANPRLYFKAMAEALDHEVGRLFDTLQTIQKWDSTDIIFIGDNGDDVKVAQNVGTGGGSKGSIYQNGVNVPFLVSGPSVTNPGRFSDALVSTHDLFATMLEMMGNPNWQIQIPQGVQIDSRSLMPIIKNQVDSIRPWAFTEVFKNTPVAGDGKAIRNRHYKLLDFDNGTQKFYKIDIDPNENNDLMLQTLNSEAAAHYAYLCGEMTNLTGFNRFCDVTATSEISTQPKIRIHPNPFKNHLEISGLSGDETLVLWNSLGQEVFTGKGQTISLKNEVPSGLYQLEIRAFERSNFMRIFKE